MPRRLSLGLLLLLLVVSQPSGLVHAQPGPDKCLVEDSDDNQVVGKLQYVDFEHPSRAGVKISGYKLILPTPRCYLFKNSENTQTTRDDQVMEVAISSWLDWADFLKRNVGNVIKVTGRMRTNLTAYVVAVPQITPKEVAVCDTSGDAGKC